VPFPSVPADGVGAILAGVFTLTTGRWDPSGFHAEDTEDPQPEDVMDAVRSFDGSDRNDAYLRHHSGRWMGFGAGPDRVFVSFSDSEEGPRYQAVASDTSDGTVNVRIGGQAVELPDKYLLPLALAVEAAVEFLATGAQPGKVMWEPQ
jgi:hypothetical protein